MEIRLAYLLDIFIEVSTRSAVFNILSFAWGIFMWLAALRIASARELIPEGWKAVDEITSMPATIKKKIDGAEYAFPSSFNIIPNQFSGIQDHCL